MDVRAIQRLSYERRLFSSRCVYSVSPHAISIVRRLWHILFEPYHDTSRLSAFLILSPLLVSPFVLEGN